MKYVIMCAGRGDPHRFLSMINGEPLIYRTVEMLLGLGIRHGDIYITLTPQLAGLLAAYLGVPVDTLLNPRTSTGLWSDCFVFMNEPVCYLFGDVVYSDAALKTIVNTDTDDIEFFASAPPFAPNYSKEWAEPFAFKVKNNAHLKSAIKVVEQFYEEGKFKRKPIAWEVWQVIKNTPLNKINYHNYTVINDYTCDVDELDDILKFEGGTKWPIT